jgi:hypothetical protein
MPITNSSGPPGHYFCDKCDDLAFGPACRVCSTETRFIKTTPSRGSDAPIIIGTSDELVMTQPPAPAGPGWRGGGETRPWWGIALPAPDHPHAGGETSALPTTYTDKLRLKRILEGRFSNRDRGAFKH